MKLGSLKIDPLDYGSRGAAVLGIRDSGKTYTATLLAEQLYDAGIPFVAFDPVGVWRFLRVPGGGRGARGYPVVVAGGVDGDLPLTPATAPAIVRAAMAEGVSLVIDLFHIDLSKADWKRIVRDCVKVLLHENKAHGLRHIFLEEAAEFCPQRVTSDVGAVYAEIEKLARMGGNNRLGFTLINQRAAEVNKAVLELCDNLILHRQKGKNSLEALSKWLDVGGVAGGKDLVRTLSTLPTGQAYCWLGQTDRAELVEIQAKRSLHPDRRVMRGDPDAAPAKPVDATGFVDAMQKALPEIEAAAEASDPKRLQARIRELEGKLAQNEVAQATNDEIETQRLASKTAGYAQGYDAGAKAMLAKLQDSEAQAAKSAMQVLDGLSQGLADAKVTLGCIYENALQARMLAVEEVREAKGLPPTPAPVARQASQPNQKKAPVCQPDGVRNPLGAERKPLQVLVDRHPAAFTDAQWATLAGLKRSGGTWGQYKSRLKTAGYVEQDGNLWRASALGLAALPAGTIATDDPIQKWKQALGAGPSRMLDVFLANPAGSLSRQDIAKAVELEPTGGTFGQYLSRLKANGLIEKTGDLYYLAEVLAEQF